MPKSRQKSSPSTPLATIHEEQVLQQPVTQEQLQNDLLKAVEAGNLEIVTELLHRGANVNETTEKGDIPLHTKNGDTPLHVAARHKHLEIARLLLKNNAVMQKANNNFPIIYTILNNDAPMFKLFLSKHDNKTTLDAQKLISHLLGVAVAKELSSIAQQLVAHSLDIPLDANGYNALHCAIAAGNERAVERLLQEDAYRAKISLDTEDGKTPLLIAAEKENTNITKMLLGQQKHVAIPEAAINEKILNFLRSIPKTKCLTEIPETPNFQTSSTNLALENISTSIDGLQKSTTYTLDQWKQYEQEFLKLAPQPIGLIAEKLNTARSCQTELEQLFRQCEEAKKEMQLPSAQIVYFSQKLSDATNSYVQQNRELTSLRGELDEFLSSLSLSQSVQKGELKTVKKLLARGANANATNEYGNTLLHLAAITGNLQIVQKLLHHDADIDTSNNDGNTPLHIASAVGEQLIVQELLRVGANINAKNKWGDTPLSLAAQSNNLPTVETLLQHNATMEPDSQGKIPLHHATEKNHVDIVKHLVTVANDKGIILAEDKSRRSSLFLAATHNLPDVLRLFIEQPGINIDMKNSYGVPLLCFTANSGHTRLVELLLENGANIEITSDIGATPLLVAAREQHWEVIRLLLSKGAKIPNPIIPEDEDALTFIRDIQKEQIKQVTRMNTVSIPLSKEIISKANESVSAPQRFMESLRTELQEIEKEIENIHLTKTGDTYLTLAKKMQTEVEQRQEKLDSYAGELQRNKKKSSADYIIEIATTSNSQIIQLTELAKLINFIKGNLNQWLPPQPEEVLPLAQVIIAAPSIPTNPVAQEAESCSNSKSCRKHNKSARRVRGGTSIPPFSHKQAEIPRSIVADEVSASENNVNHIEQNFASTQTSLSAEALPPTLVEKEKASPATSVEEPVSDLANTHIIRQNLPSTLPKEKIEKIKKILSSTKLRAYSSHLSDNAHKLHSKKALAQKNPAFRPNPSPKAPVHEAVIQSPSIHSLYKKPPGRHMSNRGANLPPCSVQNKMPATLSAAEKPRESLPTFAESNPSPKPSTLDSPPLSLAPAVIRQSSSTQISLSTEAPTEKKESSEKPLSASDHTLSSQQQAKIYEASLLGNLQHVSHTPPTSSTTFDLNGANKDAQQTTKKPLNPDALPFVPHQTNASFPGNSAQPLTEPTLSDEQKEEQLQATPAFSYFSSPGEKQLPPVTLMEEEKEQSQVTAFSYFFPPVLAPVEKQSQPMTLMEEQKEQPFLP